jgi:hypothetical protein
MPLGPFASITVVDLHRRMGSPERSGSSGFSAPPSFDQTSLGIATRDVTSLHVTLAQYAAAITRRQD